MEFKIIMSKNYFKKGTIISLSAISMLFISSCSQIPVNVAHEQFVTAKENETELTFSASELIKESKTFMMVCPYSGKEVNEEYDQKVFRDNEDEDDSKNWFIIESQNAPIMKDEILRTTADFCSLDSDLKEKASGKLPADTQLTFERESFDKPWILTDIN